jgi:hypothetical protein
MDRREPIEIGSTEPGAEHSGPKRSFAPFAGTPMVRRLAVGRLALWILAGLLATGLFFAGGSRVVQSAVTWLHQQDQYKLNFRDIALEPDPPAWIKGGREGLLRRVQTRSRLPESLSTLELDLQALAIDFRRESPWFVSVNRVEIARPNRLTVRVAYRRPAAYVRLGRDRVVLDGDGVVLPEDELDLDATGPLIELRGLWPQKLDTESVEALPGKALQWLGNPVANGESSPQTASAASRLAGFFIEKEAVGPRPEKKVVIKVLHQDGELYYAETSEAAMIRWGKAPGSEDPGDLSAERKWETLIKWAAGHSLKEVKYPAYLDFDGDQVVRREPGLREPG